MIDLQPAIREYLLSDSDFSSKLSNYLNSKALFTRRPVPTDAEYPMSIISPIVSDLQNDFVTCGGRRILTYDIVVYSDNDNAASYRNVEAAAFRLANILHRMPNYSLNLPASASLIQTTAIGPLPGPTDDIVKVARVVSVNIEIFLENY